MGVVYEKFPENLSTALAILASLLGTLVVCNSRGITFTPHQNAMGINPWMNGR